MGYWRFACQHGHSVADPPVLNSLLVYRLVHAPVIRWPRESGVRLPDREHIAQQPSRRLFLHWDGCIEHADTTQLEERRTFAGPRERVQIKSEWIAVL